MRLWPRRPVRSSRQGSGSGAFGKLDLAELQRGGQRRPHVALSTVSYGACVNAFSSTSVHLPSFLHSPFPN
eukprot:598433-Lingulodinium_polyedra.AAC.1